MRINNPYLYHVHPLCNAAAEDLRSLIAARSEWEYEFGKGKMLGVLVVERAEGDTRVHYLNNKQSYLAAYSGLVEISPNDVFVPPIYNLNSPEDFYREEEKVISSINREIAELSGFSDNSKKIAELKIERKQRSQLLQVKIFKHFNFVNHDGETKNIIDIFADAKRGLPPGGAGECAAPRLLQYAFTHNLRPLAMAEFWYGATPRQEIRIHRQFYPSCIEKCSPILKFMLPKDEEITGIISKTELPEIIFEDDHLIILNKPAEVLSVPAKDTNLFNVEAWLHETHPQVHGPMLVHRLDQSTSGLMIAAKNAATFKALQQGFLEHRIRKTYLAWLDGIVPSESGVLNLPICPNPDDRPRQVLDYQFGKAAITRYKVLKRETEINEINNEKAEDRTLIEFHPLTGRTHQLRLHAASPFGLDQPIIGDRIYFLGDTGHTTKKKESRLMLHATKISFQHPITGEWKEFIRKPEF